MVEMRRVYVLVARMILYPDDEGRGAYRLIQAAAFAAFAASGVQSSCSSDDAAAATSGTESDDNFRGLLSEAVSIK
jgi:hypothetical protein